MRGKCVDNERGMMTVEAVLSLVPFILVILGIISFINIFAVHNKIQYAMYQAGSELSAYTYFYEALGIRSGDKTLGADIDKGTIEIDDAIKKTSDFIGQIDSISSVNDVQDTVQSGKDAIDAGRVLLSDPQTLMRNLVYYGIEAGEGALKSWILDTISSSLMPVYLESTFSPSNPMTADEYLKRSGVVNGMKGLDFSRSKLFQDKKYKMIDMVVEYDLEIPFFELFMKRPVIHIVQRCAIPAWLDGDGVHYQER